MGALRYCTIHRYCALVIIFEHSCASARMVLVSWALGTNKNECILLLAVNALAGVTESPSLDSSPLDTFRLGMRVRGTFLFSCHIPIGRRPTYRPTPC